MACTRSRWWQPARAWVRRGKADVWKHKVRLGVIFGEAVRTDSHAQKGCVLRLALGLDGNHRQPFHVRP